MNVCVDHSEAKKLTDLKKRLFIIVCNVATAALLLLYVTYSQYRINMAATLQMPQAAQIYAALTLSPNQSAGATVDSMGTFLSKLAPGDDPMAFAENSEDVNHHFTVTVSNAEELTAGDETTTVAASQVAMTYHLRVCTTGHIPLKMVLAVSKEDGGTEYYVSYKVVHEDSQDIHGKNVYYFLPKDEHPSQWVIEHQMTKWILEHEQTFSFEAEEAQTHTYQIYCGWDPSDEDGDYRKEVEHLEVRAELVSVPGTVENGKTPEQITVYQPKPETTDTP